MGSTHNDGLMRRLRELEHENAELRLKYEISELEQQLSTCRIEPDLQATHIIPNPGSRTPLTSTPRANPVQIRQSKQAGGFQASERSFASRGASVKPATYDGTTSWLDYRAHFETCAEINNWNLEDKGRYLAVSLRGQAQGVFGNLSSNSRDYDALQKALGERFAPPNQTELYRVQLRERRQRASESLSELGQEIRRLTNLAYPSAPPDLKETLAKEQFVDALHSTDMRLRVKQARPTDLNDAIRHAVELEAFNKAERSKLEGQGIIGSTSTSDKNTHENSVTSAVLKSLQESIEKLEKQVSRLQYNKNRDRRKGGDNQRRCYICGSQYHLRAKCPTLQNGNPQGTQNHNDDKGKNIEYSAATTSNAYSVGNGLFIPVEFSGQTLNCLVDTGATLTLLSSHAWEASPLSKQRALESYDKTLISASGTPMRVGGKTNITLRLDGIPYKADVVIADIECDLMMGLDFMQEQNCSIDVAEKILMVRGKTIGLSLQGSIGCYRVTASQDIIIPARSEIVTKGKVPDMRKSSPGMFLVEPSDRMRSSGKGLVAKTLVQGAEEVPLRIMNVSDEDQTLRKDTHIGTLNPVAMTKQIKKHTETKGLPSHLEDLYQRTTNDMTPKQSADVLKLLLKYSSVFSKSDDDIGRTGLVRHRIDTGDAHPIKQPMRRNPVHMNPEIDKQIDDMLAKDVIQPSSSPWTSGIVLVTKKDGSKRFCIDYRKLNDVTLKDSYPLPRIDDSLEQLSGAQWFSCLDLNTGYWQVEVEDADRPKTAFSSRRGLYEFKVMPFGLCNAPATFERLMETVLSGLNWQICLIYLDDIIVHGRTFEEMISNLERVFMRLQDGGLKLKPRKCQLFCKEVLYLGHIVSDKGIKTDPQKTETIRDWPIPENVTEVRSFLGLCSYYRRFVDGYATIAKPLHKLTEKSAKFEWDEKSQKAFDALKQKLCIDPILAHPDFSREFILDTDASDFGIGAVLSQRIDGQEKVVAYASKSLTKAERRYCVTRKELYAVVHFVKHFRHYLYGKHFTVRTDHGSLRWLMNFKNPEGQLARWLEVLSAYDMKIEHRAGRRHLNADGLSRKPCKQCGLTHITIVNGSNVNQVKSFDSPVSICLSEAQTSDPDLVKLRTWLETKDKPDSKILACESRYLKTLIHQWENLDIKDDVLMRRFEAPDSGHVDWQGIVPLSRRREVLRFCHDIRSSGHLGITKTLRRVSSGYYWPGVKNDVQTYVNGCETCTKRKDPCKTKRAPMEIVRSGFPMERLAIDILGPLPETDRGNRYILVIGDYFTKWTESHAMPDMEAKTVAMILVEQVVSRFGVPNSIHSDQGRQFESQLFKEMCTLLQIEKTRTSPYHAMSDGMVERFNKTLEAMLSAFVNENHTDWDEHLQLVMMAYRSSEHDTTGFTPNLCMLGRETGCPLDLMYEMPTALKHTPVNQWVWELQEKLENAHRIVRQNTGKAMKRQKTYHDHKLSFESFDAGDKVYVFFPIKKVGCSSKLTSFWKGPYEVVKKLTDVLYKVNCGRSNNNQVIHCNRMRKCKKQTFDNEQIHENTAQTNENIEQSTATNECPILTEHSPECEYEVSFESKREKRKPAWMKDYVFSIFRNSAMVNTKTTERKANLICPACSEPQTSDGYQYHIEVCLLKLPNCGECHKTFKNRKSYLQHLRKKHQNYPSDSAANESDWEEQSECEVGEEMELGRTICKRTAPSPVFTPPPKKHRSENELERPAVVIPDTPNRPVMQVTQGTQATLTTQATESQETSTERKRGQFSVVCKVDNDGELVRKKVTISDDRGEIFSSSSSARGQRARATEIRLKDVIEEEGIDVDSVVFSLHNDGEVRVDFDCK